MRVVGVIGNVVLRDKDDMVVAVAGVFEQAVHVQGIGLMAVIGKARGGGHHHGIAVLEGLIGDAFVADGLFPAAVGLPVPQLVHGGFAGVVVTGVIIQQVERSVGVAPIAVPGSQLADVGFPVEDPAAGGARHAGDAAGADAPEALCEAFRRPAQLVSFPVAGVHHGHNGFPEGLQPGGLLVGKGQAQEGDAVKELGIAALEFLSAEGLSGGREAAFRTAGERHPLIFVLEFALEREAAG